MNKRKVSGKFTHIWKLSNALLNYPGLQEKFSKKIKNIFNKMEIKNKAYQNLLLLEKQNIFKLFSKASTLRN